VKGPRLRRSLSALLLWMVASPLLPAAPALTRDQEDRIRAIVRTCQEERQAPGVVVGVVTRDGRWVYGKGVAALGLEEEPDGDTLYEIGSLSKVFLDLLLEQLVLDGKVRMEDPVAGYLPADMSLPKLRRDPSRTFKSDRHPPTLTLWHLATHTSGFPTMPASRDIPKGWSAKDPSYVTLGMAREYFRNFTFPRSPGSEYEYSNINTGLLGYLLSLKEGVELDRLLQEKVLGPLGMKDTVIEIGQDRARKLARGYESDGKPAKYINTPLPFSGGGSLKSTANDLLKYMEQNLGLVESPLRRALDREQELIELTGGGPPRTICYFHYPQPYGDVLLIRSRTLGFRCCMGFIPSRKIGVVVLGNCMRFDTPKIFREVLETVVGGRTVGKNAFQPMD